MNEVETFADAAERWVALVQRAGALPLSERIEAFTAHLIHLYGAGLRLPGHPEPPDRNDAGEWPEDWPGFEHLEGERPTLTTLIHGITSDLQIGAAHLARSPEAGAAWWRASFEHRWGTLAAATLPRLHAALTAPPASPAPEPDLKADSNLKTDPQPCAPRDRLPETVTASPAGPALLQHVPEPPTRRSTRRARPRADSPGVLGLRCDPEPDGLRISAVHPQGPAADHLYEGDLLLSIDGSPLGGLTVAAAQAALSSAPEQLRELTYLRQGQRAQISLTAVSPQSLAGGPATIRLLLLDQDAAYALLGALHDLDLEVEPDPEHDGVVVLTASASVAPTLTASLAAGSSEGIWELLP